MELQSLRFKCSIGSIEVQYENFFVPNFLCPFLSQRQMLHNLREKSVQLSVQGRHGDFSFLTEFAHFRDPGLFPPDKVPSTLEIDSTSFPVLEHMSALSQEIITLDDACCRLLPLAAENQGHRWCESLLLREQW